MLKFMLTGLVGAALLAGGSAHAQTANTAAAVRKAGMDLAAAAAGAAKRALDSGADLKPLKSTAEALAAWGRAYPNLFVPGSETGDTKVKPEAITDHAGLEKAAMALTDAALKLAAAAEANDKAAFATAFGEVGAACSGCHRTYRQR
jgi:cytochrome c556